jgi:hypothetical protein
MKRITRIVPLMLPPLTDQAAAQLIDILHALLAIVEHHYAHQIHRYRKRESERLLHRAASDEHTTPFDPPF